MSFPDGLANTFNNMHETHYERAARFENWKMAKTIALVVSIAVLAIALIAAIFGGIGGFIAGLILSIPAGIVLHDCIKAGNRIEKELNILNRGRDINDRLAGMIGHKFVKMDIAKEVLQDTLLLKHIFG
jgi:hypothetical protein